MIADPGGQAGAGLVVDGVGERGLGGVLGALGRGDDDRGDGARQFRYHLVAASAITELDCPFPKVVMTQKIPALLSVPEPFSSGRH